MMTEEQLTQADLVHIIPEQNGDDALETIGETLRKLREGAEISADQVARELNMHKTYITAIEKRRRRVPDGFPGRYMDALLRIHKRRGAALGQGDDMG